MKPSKHPPTNNILYLKSSQLQKKNEAEELKKEIARLTQRLNRLEKKYTGKSAPSNLKAGISTSSAKEQEKNESHFPAKGSLLRYLPFIPDRSILSEEIDPFGRDPNFEKKLKPFFDFSIINTGEFRRWGWKIYQAKEEACLSVIIPERYHGMAR